MSFNKNKKIQSISIILFALIIGCFSTVYDGYRAKKSDDLFATTTESKTPTAGVSSLVEKISMTNTSLTAGLSSQIYNATEVTVEENEVDTVASSYTTDNIAEVCGYDNLGIADITEGNLNIRSKASTNAKIVGKMTKHNACEILKSKNGWCKIKSGNVTGWVKSEYLLKDEEALEIAVDEVQTVATVENTQTLRVRAKKSTSAKTIELIGEGEDLVVVDESDGWYKVEVDDDNKGYISSDYASISLKLTTAKSVTQLNSNSDSVSTDTRSSLVAYALQFVGNRYVWGGTSLTNGIDCSGFTMQIYARFGISLPHHAASQPAYGTRISASQAQPGDLFFYGSGGIGHVAIYIGNGQIVHAANARSGIIISNAYYSTPVCVCRYLN